jgi:hypothetical protein
MRSFFFFALFGAIASAQVHEVRFPGSLTPLNITPTFDHGYTAVYDRDQGSAETCALPRPARNSAATLSYPFDRSIWFTVTSPIAILLASE